MPASLRTLRAIFLTGGALLFLVGATPVVPQDTGAFLTYCESHLEDCRVFVVGIDDVQKMIQLINHERACSLPWHMELGTSLEAHKAAHQTETLAILQWLKANAAARSSTTKAAIVQAMAALWPQECQKL